MRPEMLEAMEALASERGISVEKLYEALADALEMAYKRMPGAHEYSWVAIDPETAEIRVLMQELDEDGEPCGEEYDVTPQDFGRIAAQTARQVMTYRIREAERDRKYEEYTGREGHIVTGIIQQSDARYTLLDLGRVEALLPQAEQVPFERPDPSSRLKAYIVEVRRTARGPQIVVSRTHPGLVKCLFELELPEIADGTVEIKACAREPGHRTKIAVDSKVENVDPVGACVGARGARVRNIVNELRGEKIDIITYTEDLAEFIMKALAPAATEEVHLNEDNRSAEVIVRDHQLSLAIGKEGQNARLAARLTGWSIQIKSRSQVAAEAAYGEVDWAEGEWILDPETGQQMWQPADGSAPITIDEYESSEDWTPDSKEEGSAGGAEGSAGGAEGSAEEAAEEAAAGEGEAAGGEEALKGEAGGEAAREETSLSDSEGGEGAVPPLDAPASVPSSQGVSAGADPGAGEEQAS